MTTQKTMSQLPIKEQLENMRRYFQTGATLSYEFRKEQLLKLKKTILKYEKELHAALYADLKKSEEESWVTETGFLLTEINATITPSPTGSRVTSIFTI